LVPYSHMLSLGGPFRVTGQQQKGSRELDLVALTPGLDDLKEKEKLIDASYNLQPSLPIQAI